MLHERGGEAFFTVRSVLLGALMCFVIGIAGPYWTYYLHASTLFLDYSVGGAVFLLFVLILVTNGILRYVWRSLALAPGELVVVTAMMLIAGGITTMGLVGYLVPNITAPYYLASPVNNWEEQLWPYLPRWISPLDPGGGIDSIIKFYTGLKEGDSIPWGVWWGPLLRWGIFLAALYGFMISLMAIVRKQWVDYERLSYPIAQVYEELCVTAAGPWSRGSVFRSVLFWFGFAVPFLVGSLTALHAYFPTVPAPKLSMGITDLGPITLPIRLSFAVLGFTFLIPNRVAFSLWFLNILSYAFRSILKANRLEMVENLGIYGASPYPIMAHQGMGAMIVFVVAIMWFSRRHLKRVLLSALGREEKDYDANEPVSYRAAVVLLVVSFVVMVVWMNKAGLAWRYSLIFILAAMLIFLGLTRVVAQCGVSVTIAPMIASPFMTSTFGGGA